MCRKVNKFENEINWKFSINTIIKWLKIYLKNYMNSNSNLVICIQTYIHIYMLFITISSRKFCLGDRIQSYQML